MLFLTIISLVLFLDKKDKDFVTKERQIMVTVAALGLSDLCISTEARYTRHPAVSDSIVPFMDYPGSFEHFPTGSFWAPPVLE